MTTARVTALACSGVLIFFAASAAVAQTAAYPAKAIRWIVPYPPGGGTDMLSRAVGQKFAEAWSVPVVMENRPGGATNIGAEAVAKSPPDGYTLFPPTVANAINVTLFPKLNYDILRDFAHITNLAKFPNIVVVHPSLPARNAKELIALAKARPGELRHASAGIGSPSHLGAELFKSLMGVKMVHIPYRGAGPALVDIAGGHVEVYFGTIVSTLPHVRSNRVRAIGVSSLKRAGAAQDIMTLHEQGIKDFEAVSWVLVSAPANTPRDIIMKIHREAVRAIGMPDVRDRLAADGAEFIGDTPEQVTAFLKGEIEKWGKAVKASGAKPEG
jgi:tripartite-type tricarboxylate transporter receptor subunit TctC